MIYSFSSIILCLLFVDGLFADRNRCACPEDRFLEHVVSTIAGLQTYTSGYNEFVLATPIENESPYEFKLENGQTLESFKIKDGKSLSKNGDFKGEAVVLYMRSNDSDCGFDNTPVKYNQRQILSLRRTVNWELTDLWNLLKNVSSPIYTLQNCREIEPVTDACVYDYENDKPQCLSEAASVRIADVAATLQLTNNDIDGIESFCTAPCQNCGICVPDATNGAQCQCCSAFSGEFCEKAAAVCDDERDEDCRMIMKTIIPGNGKNDAWQLGAKREISFQVIGYSEQALTQKVQVFLVNEACRHNVYLDSPIALQSIKNRYNGYSLEEYGHLMVGVVDLKTASANRKSFTAKLEVTLGADDISGWDLFRCAKPSDEWRVFLLPVRTDEQASTDEVDAVEGKHFEVVTSSCLFQSGLIGECRASCSRDLAEVAFGVVAYGQDDEACPGQLKCCAHGYRDNREELQTSRYFTMIAPIVGAAIAAGSTITVEWSHAERDEPICPSPLVRFELHRVVKGFFSTSREPTSVVFTAPFVDNNVTLDLSDSDQPLVAGMYTLKALCDQAYENGRRRYLATSGEFDIFYPSCSLDSNGKETLLGNCRPDSACGHSKNANMCSKPQAGVSCCYRQRNNNSPGFKDSDVTLDNTAVSLHFSMLLSVLLLVIFQI